LEHGNNFEEKLISRLSEKGFLGPASFLKKKSGRGEEYGVEYVGWW
jgi:hypothetical protein